MEAPVSGSGLRHQKLSHHALVFVLQHMTVVHKSSLVIRKVLECHQHSHGLTSMHMHGILESHFLGRWRLTIAIKHTELVAVNMEGMNHRCAVIDFPDFCITQANALVNVAHGHGAAIDANKTSAKTAAPAIAQSPTGAGAAAAT